MRERCTNKNRNKEMHQHQERTKDTTTTTRRERVWLQRGTETYRTQEGGTYKEMTTKEKDWPPRKGKERKEM